MNIGPAQRLVFEIRRNGEPIEWRPLAKDGADLPAGATRPGAARRRLAVGETFDAEFVPDAPGEYELVVRVPNPARAPIFRQVLIAR